MAQYHYNMQSGEAEECYATVRCEHGDINTDHFSSLKSLTGDPTLRSLALFRKVKEISYLNEEATAVKVGDAAPYDRVKLEVANLSCAVGRLASGANDEDTERFRSALLRCQNALTDALGEAANVGEGLDVTLALVKATNLLAEVGSGSSRRPLVS